MYTTIAQIEQANIRYGQTWFSPESMKFFNSRIASDVLYGQYFISSERYNGEPRYFTVRRADATGNIETIGEFQGFKTAAQAKKWLSKSIEKGAE